jgi:hypothetical protein
MPIPTIEPEQMRAAIEDALQRIRGGWYAEAEKILAAALPSGPPTPKLDAEIQRVNDARRAEGLGPLTRHKAIAQLGAERCLRDAVSNGMETTPGTLDMWAWLVMEPVIELPPSATEPKWPYKLIASCEGEADGAVLDMLIAHGCPAREDVLAAMREGERTDIEGLLVERVPGGWHLLREGGEE